MTKRLQKNIGHFMRLYLLLALFISSLPQVWAQDTPPSDAHVISLTVLHDKYIGMQVMVSGEQTFWVETAPGEFLKRTITSGWSSKEGFLSSGTTMKVYGNITGFDIQNNFADITGIDVTKCPNLTTLIVSNNTISTLNLTNNRELTHLSCEDNQLTSLDVSQNTMLGWIDCSKNQLTELNVSRNTVLYQLICHNNSFTANALNALYCSLPVYVPGTTTCNIGPAYWSADPNFATVTASNSEIATAKGWNVRLAADMGNSVLTTTGTGTCSNITPPAETPFITLNMLKDAWGVNILHAKMTSNSANTVVWIETTPGKINSLAVGESWEGILPIGLGTRTSLRIYGNISGFHCANNGEQIQGIDLGGNPALKELNCSDTKTKFITFGEESQLNTLTCFNTNLNINKLYCDLPTHNISNNARIYPANSESDVNIDQVIKSNAGIANGKGWSVLYMENKQEISTTGTITCEQLTPPTNAKVIAFVVGKDMYDEPFDNIGVDFRFKAGTENTKLKEFTTTAGFHIKAAAENTPIWIETTPGEYQTLTIGTDYSKPIVVDISRGEFKIYGDIIGLDCSDNDATSGINLSGNDLVQELNVSKNQSLQSLTLGNNSKILMLNIVETAININSLLCDLPSRTEAQNATIYLADEDESLMYLQRIMVNPEIARQKGWKVLNSLNNEEIILDSPITCDLLTPPTNTPFVTLKFVEMFSKGKTLAIEIKIQAASDGTLAWIDAGNGALAPVAANIAWSSFNIPLNSNTIKIYGNITGLDCSNNRPFLTGIDISNSPSLKDVRISRNFITNLNVSANPNLKNLECYETLISTSVLNKLYCDLPAVTTSATIKPAGNTTDENYENVVNSNANIAREKGWNVLFAATPSDIPTEGTITCDQLTPPANAKVISMEVNSSGKDPYLYFDLTAASEETRLWIELPSGVMNTIMVGTSNVHHTEKIIESGILKIYGDVTGLVVNDEKITGLNASGNSSLVKLDCSNSNISSLITGENAALKYLNCSNNYLQELDFTKNTALEYLNCSANKFEELNVSQLGNLSFLKADNNKLLNLDISSNAKLSYVECQYNNISELKLGNNPALTYLKLFYNNFTTAALDGVYCGLPTHESGVSAALFAALDRNSADEAFVLATNSTNATTKRWTVLDNSPAPIETVGTYECGNVAGVTLSRSNLIMTVGVEHTLLASVQPNNAQNQSVTWTNSNTSAVNLVNGKITALAPGTATITVTTNEGGYTATCEVNVIESLPANLPVITLTVKENATIRNIDLVAAEVNTPVWIESEAGIYSKIIASTSWHGYFDQKVNGTAIKLYGNITTLDCSDNGNNFLAINISGNPVLKELWVKNNSLSSLDVSQNPDLKALFIEGNRFSTNALNDIYCGLSYRDGGTVTLLKDPMDNNYATVMASNANIAKEKGWTVTYSRAPMEIKTQGTYTCGSVYDIMISETTRTLNVGDNFILNAMVLPATASNQTITWSSNDNTVATVENGTVTGLAAGTAIITATSEDGQFTATCIVTVVNVDVIGVTLSETSKNIEIEESFMLTATIAPANATFPQVNWSSSNSNIATVENGVVTGVAVGTATITATTVNGNFTATCEVTVENIAVTGISLSELSKTIKVDENFTLTATVLPANAFNKNITWTSSNTTVATVENGLVKGLTAGTTTITATTVDGSFTATCEVTVENIAVTSVSLSETLKTIKVDESFTLTATVSPANAFNKNVTWSSSNNAVATVENGVVKGLTVGNATITVTTVDGDYTATCEVTVTPTVGIEDPEAISLTLYPNPTTGKVYIKGLAKTTRVQVYSTAGIQITNTLLQPNEMLDVTELKSGIYIVRVNGQSLKLSKN